MCVYPQLTGWNARLCLPNKAPTARPAVCGWEKAAIALKMSGAPLPRARNVTPSAKKKKSSQGIHFSNVTLLADTQWTQVKDTATLWERCRQVEMAERLGQKLQRERKWGENGEQALNNCKEFTSYYLNSLALKPASAAEVRDKRKQNKCFL